MLLVPLVRCPFLPPMSFPCRGMFRIHVLLGSVVPFALCSSSPIVPFPCFDPLGLHGIVTHFSGGVVVVGSSFVYICTIFFSLCEEVSPRVEVEVPLGDLRIPLVVGVTRL